MPRSYSQHAREQLNATSADDILVILLEIRHPLLAVPVRVVGDTQNIVVAGESS
ncbi:DUF1833 family protein [Chromobacterium piscinae]|uniref:DUF1833 family protein n=1 Tax=Chromobacterium piscinae TaxID=686831 RepID=UPI003F7EAFC1